jgi:hypothetical protein
MQPRFEKKEREAECQKILFYQLKSAEDQKEYTSKESIYRQQDSWKDSLDPREAHAGKFDSIHRDTPFIIFESRETIRWYPGSECTSLLLMPTYF